MPIINTAQLKRRVDIPADLDEPWACLQGHFAFLSDNGDNRSAQLGAKHIPKIKSGLAAAMTSAEEQFGRIFCEVKELAHDEGLHQILRELHEIVKRLRANLIHFVFVF